MLAEFNLLGFNYRMTDLQGAVGIVQMAKLDRSSRNASDGRAGTGGARGASVVAHAAMPVDGVHAWQAFVTYVDPDAAPMPRNQIMESLQRPGISTRPGTHACHMLGLYRDRFHLVPRDFPAPAIAMRKLWPSRCTIG